MFLVFDFHCLMLWLSNYGLCRWSDYKSFTNHISFETLFSYNPLVLASHNKNCCKLKTNFIVITHTALNTKVGSVPHCEYLLHYVVQCTPEKERNVMKYTASSLTISLQSARQLPSITRQ